MNEESNTLDWAELLETAVDEFHSAPPEIEDVPVVQEKLPYIPVADSERMSHDDVALYFVERYKREVLYVPEAGRWVYWDGHVWRWDASRDGKAKEMLRECLRILAEARAQAAREAVYRDPKSEADPNQVYATVYKSFTSQTFHANVFKFIQTDPRLVKSLALFDSQPFEVNTPAGLVDLRTGEVTPATPASLVMRSTSCAPKKMETPLWDRFLDETFLGDQALIEYVQKMLGISLMQAQTEQVFLYMHGTGANGKDTLMNIVQGINGTDENGYSITVDSALLVDSKFQGHGTEIAQFAGARMAVTSEVPKNAKFDTSKIKKMTGGGRLSGRFMRQDNFSFEATFTLWIMANDRLQVPRDDDAFWRRLREIPFLHVVPQGKRISGLDKLIIRDEGPGVLAWMIEGARSYLADGVDTPVAVQMANAAYKEEQDTVALFIESECEREDGAFTSSRELRAAYTEWCKRENKDAITDAKVFKASLERVGVTYKPTNTVRGYTGVVLTHRG